MMEETIRNILQRKCEESLSSVRETVEEIGNLDMQHEQFVLDYMDELNRLSVIY